MPRTCRWNWLALLALAAGPTLALGQTTATRSHTVREGDTLWDLSRLHRGDPLLWPDIYRMNTSVVEDPHWIYPGEVLQLAAGDDVSAVPSTDTPALAEPVAADTSASADVSVADTAAPRSLASLVEPSDSSDQEPARLFGPPPGEAMHETLRAYLDQPYRPLRRSEFYSSGFLTEGQRLPFGRVLGPVTPPQIDALPGNDAYALPFSSIAIEAPSGATYQVGDSLLLAQLGREMGPHGDIVQPTGIARVTGTSGGRYIATVVAIYGPVRPGQQVLPLEKFTPAGSGRAVAVSDGVRATLLGGAGRQELKAPQMVVFLDKGRQDGVAPGDLFEARRRPERRSDGTMRIEEVMVTMQVVHVREHSSTARLINIVSPNVVPGTGVRQVAKLPS
ncbi:MAG: LysM peptidoglycan-binding domain-containing protein [Gemmatimonadales bacterium]|nr:LysM peptidoglycan-binding domain-containing protein [Gemmatimonadales bacterium]